MKLFLLNILFLLGTSITLCCSGQSTGDYRSNAATMTWSSAASWERYNGTSWVAASTAPSSSDGAIAIRNGHTVTVNADITVDQVIIEAGGQITLSAGTITVANGTGDDFVINGTYRRISSTTTISISSGATVSCGDGGVYEHAVSGGGSVPTIAWHINSVFRINPVNITGAPTLTQDFGIFEIACSNQTTDNVILTPQNVKNELRAKSTGSGSFQLLDVVIDGNFKQTSGIIKIRKNTGLGTANIKGNFLLEGGTFIISDDNGTSSANSVTLNIDGDFIMTGGTFRFAHTETTSGPSFAVVKRNVRLAGGSFAGWLIDNAGFYFNGTGIQTLTMGVTLVNVNNRFYYRTSGGPTGLNEIYNGTTAQNTVTGNGAAPGAGWSAWPTTDTLIKKLTINNSGGVTLSSTKTVKDSLILSNGIITTTSTNLLTLAAGSAASSGSNSSFVSGPLRKTGNTAFVFPVGKSNVIAPIGISAPVNATDHFIAEYFKNSPNTLYPRSSKEITIDHVSDCEYWILNRTNGSSNVKVQLSWAARSCGITKISELIIARWDGTKWCNHSQSNSDGTLASGTVTSNDISSFSPFTLGSSTTENPLPVSLLYFNHTCIDDSIKFSWATATETNNDFFILQRSTDAENWLNIKVLKGNGNSNKVNQYHCSDYGNDNIINYYRLKQVDYDGSSTIFQTVAVQSCRNYNSQIKIRIYPNPAKDYLTILNQNNDNKDIIIKILDINNKVVWMELWKNPACNAAKYISLSSFAKGMYNLLLQSGTQNEYKRFIKN